MGLGGYEALGPQTLKNMIPGPQRHPDSFPVDYAALFRDNQANDLGPIAKPAKASTITIALVVGGIANIIAAYELIRAGHKVQVFEDGSIGLGESLAISAGTALTYRRRAYDKTDHVKISDFSPALLI